MPPTARHTTVETHFRRLADAHGIDPPDAVEYQPHAVVFIWDGPKVAVVVDFEDLPADAPVRRPRSRSARRPD
jgi:hypothetical protein